MRTLEKSSPAIVVLLTPLVGALALGLLTRGEREQHLTAVVDKSANAGLSDGELISIATTNMKALNSYWVEFEGQKPAAPVSPTTRMTMSGYEQVGKGWKLTLTGARTTDPDATLESWTILDAVAPTSSSFGPGMIPLPGRVDTITAADGGNLAGYFSLDAGKTWRALSGEAGLMLVFLCAWNPGAQGIAGQALPPCGGYPGNHMASLTAAEPPTGEIDGVPVRHLRADVLAAIRGSEAGNFGLMLTYEPVTKLTMDVWVSTDATPRILRMRFDAAKPPPDNGGWEPTPTTTTTTTTSITWSLTWSFSRFNEQFDEIEAPPTEAIR